MIIKLNNEMSKLLLEEVEDAQSLISNQRKLDSDVKELEVSDIEELQLLVNDEIVYRGLDQQETVNNLGKKLIGKGVKLFDYCVY